MNAAELRSLYGQDLPMVGGIDERAGARGRHVMRA
jgi:hypothetical protein